MIDFTLITPISDFPKTWKTCILYLSPSRASNSVIRGSDDARKVLNFIFLKWLTFELWLPFFLGT